MARTLPADPEGMNEARADWADEALRCFMSTTGTDAGDAIADLLADVMHLCDRQPERYGSFADALRRAQYNYQAETTAE